MSKFWIHSVPFRSRSIQFLSVFTPAIAYHTSGSFGHCLLTCLPDLALQTSKHIQTACKSDGSVARYKGCGSREPTESSASAAKFWTREPPAGHVGSSRLAAPKVEAPPQGPRTSRAKIIKHCYVAHPLCLCVPFETIWTNSTYLNNPVNRATCFESSYHRIRALQPS